VVIFLRIYLFIIYEFTVIIIIIIIIIIKNEKIGVTVCENAAGALYIVNEMTNDIVSD